MHNIQFIRKNPVEFDNLLSNRGPDHEDCINFKTNTLSSTLAANAINKYL